MKVAEVLDLPGRFARRLFIDPLSVKELSGIARRWQIYVGRCLYIALTASIVWIFDTSLRERGARMSPSAIAEMGRTLFNSFFFLQLVVVTLSGVTSASDMITREVRGGTLGLLALTPLSPWRIVAGKWKAALLQTSTVLLCGAPVFAVCAFLGGVGPAELACSLTLSVVGASLGAAVSLWCSAFFRTSYVATIVTLIALLVYCVAPLLPMFAISRSGGGDEYMTFLAWTHPLYAAVGTTMSPVLSSPWSTGWLCASPLSMLLVFLLLRGCTARVVTLIRRPGSGLGEAPSAQAPADGDPRSSFVARMLRGRSGVWQSNAILWKELSTRRIGTGCAARVGVALLAFLMLTTLGAEEWWRVLILWFSWIILYLVALANGVSLFVTEREERKWDVLLSTPLRARDIVAAKLLAGLAGMAALALLLVVFWSLMTLAYGGTFPSVVMGMGGPILGVLLTYVVGAFMSLNAPNQRAAFSAAFGVMVLLLFVLPIVVGMLEGFRVLPRDGDYAEYFIGVTNPGTYLVYLSDLLSRSYHWNASGSQWLIEKTNRFWDKFEFFVALYGVLIAGLVAWIHQRFDRAAGRS